MQADDFVFNRLRLCSYAYSFSSACMTIYPLFSIMFIERSGLSTGDISVLFFIWSFSALLFEVPTGVLADRYSRRWSLVGSTVLQGSCFVVWLVSPSFTGYAIGFLVWAIGYTMQSGAAQAYLYDELDQMGRSDQFTKIFTRNESMLFAGMVVAYGAAYLIGPREYTTLLVTSSAMCLVAALFAAALPRERPRRHSESDATTGSLREAVTAVRGSRHLLTITVSIATIAGITLTVEEYVPIYYRLVGLDVSLVPMALLVGLFVTSLLAWHAHRFEKQRGLHVALVVVVAGVFLLGTSFGSMIVATLGMFVFMRALLLTTTVLQASLQHGFDGRSRATLGSLPTLVGYVVSLVTIAAWGIATTIGDDYLAVRIIAMMTAVSALGCGSMWGRRRLVERRAGDDTVPRSEVQPGSVNSVPG